MSDIEDTPPSINVRHLRALAMELLEELDKQHLITNWITDCAKTLRYNQLREAIQAYLNSNVDLREWR
jgi:hypothetical protein